MAWRGVVLRRWRSSIKLDLDESERDDPGSHDRDVDKPSPQKHPGKSASRVRTVTENIFVFALIPSLLMWTVVLLVLTGDLKGAIQVLCAAIAAGFVGWHLGEMPW